jgi:transcriptional regulator with XRE-family HTH domain
MEKGGIVIERVRLLIRQVGASVPATAQGRQQRIAKKLGISPSLLSKLEREQKSRLQDDTIKAIVDALNLDPAFLFDETIGAEPDHRAFIRRKSSAPPAEPAQWVEFAANWPRFHELTPTERDGIRRTIGLDGEHAIAHWTEWVPIAEWVLGRRKR